LQRWLHLGSVTAKVLARAECPVLTAVSFPHGDSSIHVRQILCAIDLGSRSDDVLRCAADIARHFQSALTVVHAVPGTGETLEDFVSDQYRVTITSRSRERIREIGARVGFEPPDIRVEAGDAPKVVAAAAARVNADLIVLGRSTANDLLGRLRANAYEIIRRAPCPVMSV
jgi:nucleotide-binding universal stress UspA family protein